jgi:hypothetical protein
MHLSGVAVVVLLLDGGKVDVRLRAKDARDQAVQRIRKALLKSTSGGGGGGGSGKTPKFGLKAVGKRSAGSDGLKRESQAAKEGKEEELVLAVQLEDGTQRVLEADEQPLKLLEKDKRRKLWFVPPTSLLRSPVLLAPPPEPAAVAAQPVAEQPKPPPPPVVAVAATAMVVSVDATECAVEEVPLRSVLRLNAARDDFGAVAGVLAQHPWLTQVPTLYTFALEARALDEVNAADARDLRRAGMVEAALRSAGQKKPPSVNRTTKPK